MRKKYQIIIAGQFLGTFDNLSAHGGGLSLHICVFVVANFMVIDDFLK